MNMTLKSFLIAGFLTLGLIHCGNGAPGMEEIKQGDAPNEGGVPIVTPEPDSDPDLEGASILTMSPFVGARNVELESEISVTFSRAASDIELSLDKLLYQGKRLRLRGELEYNAAENMLVFYPYEILQNNSDYQVTIRWKALPDDEEATEYSWNFSTSYIQENGPVDSGFVYRGGTSSVQPDVLTPRKTFVGTQIPTKNDLINQKIDISKYNIQKYSDGLANAPDLKDPKVVQVPVKVPSNTCPDGGPLINCVSNNVLTTTPADKVTQPTKLGAELTPTYDFMTQTKLK